MSKVICEREDLVNIADAVREKTKISGAMTLGEIATGISGISGDSVNLDTEIAAQDSLITQIQTALEGKAAGGEQETPVISVSSGGLITATAGTKSATKQLTTQAAKTITPSTSSQTAVASGKYTTGAVTVAAIPSTYVKPTTTKAATTYTPTTSNQTIAAGTYCSGAQTIKGDANLVAGNIKSGVSIFGVAGSYEGSGGSSGGGSTCNVEIYLPAGVYCFGWGEYDMYYSTDGTNYTLIAGTQIMPSTRGNGHYFPVISKRVFNNLPVGSVFTFYYSNGITGASTTGDIEFSLANHTGSSTSKYLFAVCKCNGSGTITIQI